jgi:hypothetical protein
MHFKFTIMVLASCLLLVGSVSAATLSLAERGIKITSPGLGESILEFPTLLPIAGAAEHKATATRVEGTTATITYDGGTQIALDVSDNSKIQLRFSGLTPDVRGYQMKMQVGFGEGPNRKWKIDNTVGEFPTLKAAKPHLFQGNAKAFILTNFENRSIGFTVPDYSYQQLTDAREWGWSAFFWQFNSPLNKDWKSSTISISEGDTTDIKKVALVDSFGQSTQSDWPQKVKTEVELLGDVEAEKIYYAGFAPPKLDKYGGLPESQKKLGLAATGFFHTEKKNGRWLLVNPDGNAFFHLGICAFGPGDDYTLIKDREGIYEWLPPFESEYKTAFRKANGPSVFSFHLANQIRKYKEPYSLTNYTARMISRTRQWGFNSIGDFSPATGNASAKAANFPYVSGLPLDQWSAGLQPLPGTSGIWDPFDEGNKDKVDKAFAKKLPDQSNDPLLIGYFLANEPLYQDIPKVVLGLKGTHAAKKHLASMLSDKYKTVAAFNQAWGGNFGTLDELNDATLAVKTRTAAEDMQAFTGDFLDTYFRIVTDAFHKYDKNHLLIGNRLQSGTINNEQLCRIMGKYLDVISYNYYTYTFDTAFLNRIHSWVGDKPMMLTEFYWGSPTDSGMGSRQDVSNQQERGLAYRNYVEHAAALNYIVGIEWFTLVDQATTGRWFSGFNGERGNTGLFSVTDRPWKPMIAEMVKTNYRIYDVMMGQQKPFAFNDPRFGQASGGKKTLPISRATGPITLDGIAQNWPGVPAEPISSTQLVSGGKANGLEGSFKLCWDETNLYVLVNVVDATPMQNERTAPNLWDGDGIELFLGSEKLADGGPLLFSDRQVLLGAGRSGQFYIPSVPDATAVQSAVVPGVDGKSYTIEAAIPWTTLSIKPKDNLDLLFDLGIDDGEGKGRLHQLMWNGKASNSNDRSYWGKAKLVP